MTTCQMGKEKKDKKALGDLGSFKTKDTLREEDIELTTQVNDIERRYKEIYKAVHELDQTYQSCKENFALQRYGNLKDMIKACVTDEVMEKAARYSTAGAAEEKGKAVSLMKAARQWSVGVSDASARDEVSKLHKAEIVKDIEEKKKRKEKGERRFLRLHNRLEKLKKDYEDSKQHIPTKRYMVMKEMIKPLIRDEMLKVE
ncbi:uncharacterized protein LOC123564687 [Mercenaria mercenaria]|uniref:uncharacterized protein LOC123564687 n=1 Tax=Mercenaria mercenaria TaxID=6596 RepID=UPI00234F3F0C|nr:uncharacterized protein LOC123564687 [Mercenaria mercenaria]XP_045214367.2 uncharacterized protein LOC123564687 [Mercenaria mercenaria]XP_053393323.1 uncharacterized protein LOC123564687 [Mercenaria mercenaria]XP_053393324.1 uncharacterized protein LOC123564687 [Mercenaria mercenaria]